MLPQIIEKLSNLHAHVYYDMLVAINSDRIKIAQYQWKGVVFPNTRKSNNNKKGPGIAEELDRKEQLVLLDYICIQLCCDFCPLFDFTWH